MHIEAEWPLQDAKANLSQLVNRALADGPQRITRHGRAAAVVLSERDYERLVTRTRGSLSSFLANSALREIDFDVRDRSDTGREITF
ncbi:MAG TPA: type II toxin-antitoxin system Phd/YefM family antitoxin [Candidatus Elarobacter sp.]|nr:type II toxin-antitoxin system Phd/YefM family antitoxin [Candidatus Elarobacter sp.]